MSSLSSPSACHTGDSGWLPCLHDSPGAQSKKPEGQQASTGFSPVCQKTSPWLLEHKPGLQKLGPGWQRQVKAEAGNHSENFGSGSTQESPGLWVSQGGGSLPRITVTVADRVQVHVVVAIVRGEGMDDVPGALSVFPAAPVSVLEFT